MSTSFLEQTVVTKSGRCLVAGTVHDGINHVQLIYDYLLSRYVSNDRYPSTIVVHTHPGKKYIDKCVHIKGYPSNPHDIVTTHTDGIVPLLLIGFEEQLLNHGIEYCETYLNSLMVKFEIVVVFCNTRLVNKVVLDRLYRTFNRIVTSKQWLSTELSAINRNNAVLELQTIKISINTGKVTEETELFGYSNNSKLLYPMLQSKKKNEEPSIFVAPSSAVTTVSDDNSVTAKPLLITFDSTDPEFEDEGDPDDDLDL